MSAEDVADDNELNNGGASAVLDDAVAHSATFTYPFLAGVVTLGLQRPREIHIPQRALDAMTGMERQYWEIKRRHFDVCVFFKKGKFYELYDCDAVIGNREFGLRMTSDTTNRGKMRMSGVPEQSFAEWARLFVFKGYKVGRVEQMGNAEDAAQQQDKCVPRELVAILTKGTVTEAAMLSGYDSNFVLSVYPVVAATMTTTTSTTAGIAYYDCVAVDLSRREFLYCPCRSIESTAALLTHLNPKEVVLPNYDVTTTSAGAHHHGSSPKGPARDGHAPSLLPPEGIAACKSVVTLVRAQLPECDVNTVDKLLDAAHDPTTLNSAVAMRSPAYKALGAYFAYLKLNLRQTLPSRFGDGAAAQLQQLCSGGAAHRAAPVPRDTEQHQPSAVGSDEGFELYCQHEAVEAGKDGVVALALASFSPPTAPKATPAAVAAMLRQRARADPGLTLDAAAIDALEIVANLRDRSAKHSLADFLMAGGVGSSVGGGSSQVGTASPGRGGVGGDGAFLSTPGGKRLFRNWLLRPFTDPLVIRARQQAVAVLAGFGIESSSSGNTDALRALSDALNDIWAAAVSPSSPRSTKAGTSPTGAAATPTKQPSTGAPTASLQQLDFERLLSRVLDFTHEDTRVVYTDPLVIYPKRKEAVDGLVTAVRQLAELSRAILKAVAMCRHGMNTADRGGNSVIVPFHLGLCYLQDLFATADDLDAIVRQVLLQYGQHAPSSPGSGAKRTSNTSDDMEGVLIPEKGSWPEYDGAVKTIDETEMNFARILENYRTKFGVRDMYYAELGKDVFLLEMPVACMNATNLKKIGIKDGELAERARTAKTIKCSMNAHAGLIAEYKKAVTARGNALVAYLRHIATLLAASFHVIHAAASNLATFDGLVALARCGKSQLASQSIVAMASSSSSQNEHQGPPPLRSTGVCLPVILDDDDVDRNEKADGVDRRGVGAFIHAFGVYHPIVRTLKGRSVPNDICLGRDGAAVASKRSGTEEDLADGRVLVLTGPNMGGKSTLMRTLATAVILAQLGGFVCADRVVMRPISRIFTRIGARDATHKGQSTLHVEMSELATIHRFADGRSLCLIDEPGRGTSTHDGYAIAHASLMALVGTGVTETPGSLSGGGAAPSSRAAGNGRAAGATPHPLVVFSTHYHGLALEVDEAFRDRRDGRLQLGYMDFRVVPLPSSAGATEAPTTTPLGTKRPRGADSDGEANHTATQLVDAALLSSQQQHNNNAAVVFLYKLVPGVCSRSYGIEAALSAGIPAHVVDHARLMSATLQHSSTDLQLLTLLSAISKMKKEREGEEGTRGAMGSHVLHHAAVPQPAAASSSSAALRSLVLRARALYGLAKREASN